MQIPLRQAQNIDNHIGLCRNIFLRAVLKKFDSMV
jgi:hypothetical protein